MAAMELEGNNLGEKHRTYNILYKKVLEATPMDTDLEGENDIMNLIKIDIACHNKDVEYILNVFKSQDILYVIRAVEKSTWLITDSKYSHIINVSYLQNKLFPEMTSKAKTKLLKHIKLHLKDESRVEEFYNSEPNLKLAIKWLPNCSVAFIENIVHKHLDDINPHMLKRLCEKSFTVFEKIIQNKKHSHVRKLFDSTSFLLYSKPQEYWEIFNKDIFGYGNKFNAKKTEIIMQNFPDQIIENFIKYCPHIHLPTFVQFIKRENIKGFLLEQIIKIKKAQRDNNYRYTNITYILNYDTVKVFINRMPKDEQFNFVNEVFISKSLADVTESSIEETPELFAKIQLRKDIRRESFAWYEFAPFDVAFKELKSVIPDSNIDKKYAILAVLTKCLENNLENTKNLLKYFNDKHTGDPIWRKYDFIKNLIINNDISKYDNETWNILDLIFKNMDVYAPKKDDDIVLNECINSIIIYKVVRGENVPEPVEDKFVFTTFQSLIEKLETEEKIKLFNFLFDHLFKKIEREIVTDKISFDRVVTLLNQMLNLIKDWNKELSDYPIIYNKIKELIKINESHSWETNLTSFYNIKKSWRKLFFEESVLLNPSEEVCMNALKHEPQLLTRYTTKVQQLRCNKSHSLQRVNRKLRIYWPQTIATEWTQAYLTSLDTAIDSHKTLVRGFCIIAPQETLINLIKKYTPKEAKINWSETNEMELSMRRNISLNMHVSRPQVHPDLLLGYAKGDYLKYALPSVTAIFYNLNVPQSREHIPKLLTAPVSLQKHGIRFAFMKLNTEEIKEICSNVWKNSKNATIRKVLFEFTYKLLCNSKIATNPGPIWQLLQSFIDNLTYDEDKDIYKLLADIQNIPNSVKGEYFVKSYGFLKRLLQNVKKDKETYERYINSMTNSIREVIEILPQDFVADLIQQLLDEDFYKIKDQYSVLSSHYGVIPMLTAYILISRSSEEQMERFEKLVLPLIKKSCALWDEPDKSFIRKHIQELLISFRKDLKLIVFTEKTIIPYKIFVEIQNELTKALPLPRNYLLLTKWNLVIAFTKIMNEEPRNTDSWVEYCSTIAPKYGTVCFEYLKQEVTSHFPRIYLLFIKALQENLDPFIDRKVKMTIYKSLLTEQNFIPGYLAGINLLQCGDSEAKSEISKIFLEHPSVEVKMHFHCIWNRNPLLGEY